jgi:hypothetical protein
MPAEKTELRGLAPTELVAFLDAAAMARNMDRNTMVNKILMQWAQVEAHRATVLHRATRGNPLMAEPSGSTTDWGGGL